MNTKNLKAYAPQARRDFIVAVTDRAALFGLTKNEIAPVTQQGDVAIIAGKGYPKEVANLRAPLVDRIRRDGFDLVMEAMAYTWFNRLVAIRFMELHGYLEHGYRVLSHPEGKSTPEIVSRAEHLDLPGLKRTEVIALKLDGTKEAELYRMLLIAQCNALSRAMPFLFERIDDETELLLPGNLLHSDSLIRNLVQEIPEEGWQQVEIIGWLYQFYISEKKAEVIGKVVRSENIPAATQLFTPNWIVKYLVQNSLGRQWVATYPDSPLKGQMEYYIEPAEQTAEVQQQLAKVRPTSLNPEQLTLLDPACGSGHILVEAYDLLKMIYQERGYRARDIPRLILAKNLHGLEIDDRAAQLASFALMMKARADDRCIFESQAGGPLQPRVLAIQETKGIDADVITKSLNRPLAGGDRSAGEIERSDIALLIDLFEHGKTFGSLIRVPEKLAAMLPTIAERLAQVAKHGGLLERAETLRFTSLVLQATALQRKYLFAVANPPYMGGKYFEERLKAFAVKAYKTSKQDTYSMFLERGLEFACTLGSSAMIVMESWMILSSFERFRRNLVTKHTAFSTIHMPYEGRGPTAMGISFGVAASVFSKSPIPGFLSFFSMIRHTDLDANGTPMGFPSTHSHSGVADTDKFAEIPGGQIAYWVSDQIIEIFRSSPRIQEVANACAGLQTSDNDRFLRLWHEVAFDNIGLHLGSREDAIQTDLKWFPHKKGGPFRKWYGNDEYVVNWKADGHELRNFFAEKKQAGGRINNVEYYFQEGVTWSHSTSSFFSARLLEPGFIFNIEAPSLFSEKPLLLLGYLCSRPCEIFLGVMNATLHFLAGSIAKLPWVDGSIEGEGEILECAREAVEISRTDWDSLESSWGFKLLPLLAEDESTLRTSVEREHLARSNAISRLRALEERNNALFIEAFGMQEECDPEVSEALITLYRPDRGESIQRLISYAIGCMMGRYSLDEPGLIYAHSGNEGFDSGRYTTFPADDDGVIPFTDMAWFDDDATHRLEEFLSVVWGKAHLEENLAFLAENLSPKRGETNRDTIRRYLATQFFKDHLKTYKKRPIYWLFSSGKQRAFQCLVYLHRHHEGTLGRMRTEYVIPLQRMMAPRIQQLEGDIAEATSTSHRKKLQKERDTLLKQRVELQAFDENLRHFADQRIHLDLDDGVKVNYGKFGDLLAEVKAVSGKKPD